MLNLLLKVFDNFHMYFASSLFLPLFLIGLLFLLLAKEKEEQGHFLAAGSVLILVASFFIPCIYVIKKCIGIDVYWRFYWLLPVNVVLAYLLVECLPKKQDKWVIKGVYGVIVALILVFGGSLVFSSDAFTKSENVYELPDEAVRLCDVILSQAEEGEEIRAIFPPQYVVSVRQYSAKIHQLYGRKKISKAGRKAIRFYNIGVRKRSYVGLWRIAERYDYQYLIYVREYKSDVYFTEHGYTCIGVVGDYGVYKKES